MRNLAIASVLSLAAAGAAIGTPAIAALPEVMGFSGATPSNVSGCPFIVWRLVNHDNGQVTGIAYYSDLSGLSKVRGMIEQSGQFRLTVTSVMDDGPVGTVSGTKSADGELNATMTGTGCANVNFHMPPPMDIWTYYHFG